MPCRNCRYLTLAAAGLALALPALVAPAPALAQNAKVNEIIVYGTDPARARPTTRSWSAPASRRANATAFPNAIARADRASRANPGPTGRIAFETYGRTGINSCSPVGPAGFTGCTQQLINQAFKERRKSRKASGLRTKQ